MEKQLKYTDEQIRKALKEWWSMPIDVFKNEDGYFACYKEIPPFLWEKDYYFDTKTNKVYQYSQVRKIKDSFAEDSTDYLGRNQDFRYRIDNEKDYNENGYREIILYYPLKEDYELDRVEELEDDCEYFLPKNERKKRR